MDAGGETYRFPDGFRWGAATAAFQVEGAARDEGRGESIWDRFCRIPGNVVGMDNGEHACDHFHRWPQDLELMASLGIKSYRFSVAWPRVIPGGRGQPNRAGLDFYDRLVDALLAKGIEPFVTLYHWDLPQPLQDTGGWTDRGTVEAFAAYAGEVVRRLGDRVGQWMTLNEIPIFIGQGYQQGTHAPGSRLDAKAVNQAYHHAFLAHGHAVRLVREFARKDAQVGLVNIPAIPVPVAETPANLEAASKAFVRMNGYLTEPIFRGAYAPWWLEEQGAAAPVVREGDMALISSPCDFHGLNIYSGQFVEASGTAPGYRLLPFPKGYPKLALDWLKPVPQAIYWGCRHMQEIYGTPKFYISESGCACEDERDGEGRIIDLDRLSWLRSHFQEAHRAVSEGLGLEGYFVWSLLDNFEWAEGYSKRFGIIHVDYATQERTPKESARWYSEVIRAGRVV